jgi:hypothetical protein
VSKWGFCTSTGIEHTDIELALGARIIPLLIFKINLEKAFLGHPADHRGLIPDLEKPVILQYALRRVWKADTAT